MNSINGTWVVNFNTPLGGGAGVVVLNDGKLRGGDSMMIYYGSYNENANKLDVDLRFHAHTVVPGMGSVFGIDQADIHLSGTVTGGMNAQLTGSSPQANGVTITVSMQRQMD